MKLIVALILICGNISYAQDSIYLNKDDKAPFQGYLVPEETIKSLRNDSIELGASKSLITSYQTTVDLQQRNLDIKDKQLDLMLKQNDNLATNLMSSRTLNNWEKAGYFAAGIIITALAIKGVHDLYR